MAKDTRQGQKIIGKEALYQEYFEHRDKYATLRELYDFYYKPLFKIKTGIDLDKVYRTRGSKPPGSFYVLCAGFNERRDKDVIEVIEKQKTFEAENAAKRKREVELKNDFLMPTAYLEQFKQTKSIVEYSLKRVVLKINNALNKMKIIQQEIAEGKFVEHFDDELPMITLGEGEVRQLKMYRGLFETARTALKLPVKYNTVIDDTKDYNSIGELFQLINAYQQQGGVIVDENGESLDMPAVFER